jgi:hypothetical protein
MGLCVPIAWKITQTEVWVGVSDLCHIPRPMSDLTEQYGPIQGQIFIVTPAPLPGSPIFCGLGLKKAKFFFLLIC